MTILRFTPSDWYSGLLQTARQLRTLWAHDWPGLPVVLEECLTSLALCNSDNADIADLNRFACAVGHDMEALAQSRPVDAEPAYHNRLHTADVLVAITTMLHTQCVATNTLAKPWAALLLATAMAHDYDHPGGLNRLPFEIEKRSWAALTLRANGLPAPLRQHMEQLILRTDVQAVPLNHERMTDQVFVWGLPWCQIMLNEADILIGSTPELGTGLGEALAEECVKAGFSECVTVGTAAGRVRFLRQTRFSSPAALALDMPTRVHTELNTLVSQGTI